MTLPRFVDAPPRYVFFTGKGGVGKTSIACASAVALAQRGRRVLLVSTDPASNLDEVLGVSIGQKPTPIPGTSTLWALNIDPAAAARAYRERVVAPYRGVLPNAAIASIEEQLSGACTVEIAAFDEFTALLSAPAIRDEFDHVLFDTAPTGHTLRLLELPAAWSDFLATNAGGASCLGPLSGLKGKQALYAEARRTLANATATAMILVARPDRGSLAEAERTRTELESVGIRQPRLVLNGLIDAVDGDALATAIESAQRDALTQLPAGLASLETTRVRLRSCAPLGHEALSRFWTTDGADASVPSTEAPTPIAATRLRALVEELERTQTSGVILTMGKGGVGKTTVAVELAKRLAERGHPVHLTTTDPAAARAICDEQPNLRVSRIDPVEETRLYVEEALRQAAPHLDDRGRALLEEDLRSPCTEEVAVFRAFARVVDEGTSGFVVIDTAPTGHTLLLLDAAEAYHREVARTRGSVPDAVRRLLPRLRDPSFTKVILVTLPEATPVHEAKQLEADLARAEIRPFAWVINRSLATLDVRHPVLASLRRRELPLIDEVRGGAARVCVEPWLVKES